MVGRKASKIRILMSLMKKFKKPHRKSGFVLLDGGIVHVKNSPSMFLFREGNWRKVEKLPRIGNGIQGKRFYKGQTRGRFLYEIKENYELKVNG